MRRSPWIGTRVNRAKCCKVGWDVSPPRLTDLVLHHATHRFQQQSISQAAWRDAVQVRLSCEIRAVRARLRGSTLAQRPATAPAIPRTLQTTKWPLLKTTPHSVSVRTMPIPRQALPCDDPRAKICQTNVQHHSPACQPRPVNATNSSCSRSALKRHCRSCAIPLAS